MGSGPINSSLAFLERLSREAAEQIPDGSWVLDAGSGNAPYSAAFDAHTYVASDINPKKTPMGPFTANRLEALPYRSASFDLIFCSQVLEHVPDPYVVLAELYRCLKPNGTLWLTVPLFYAEHLTPHDYHRFTRWGLIELLSSQKFEVERIDWLEGYFGTIAYQLQFAARHLPMITAANDLDQETSHLVDTFLEIAAPLGDRFGAADILHQPKSAGMPINYVAVAKKVASNTTEIRFWSDLDNYPDSWTYRTRRMAELIEPGKSVIEFGAGKRLLRDLLPRECSYTASDLVDRGPGSFVCDLNELPLPVFPDSDVAVLSGVLEYVDDISEVARQLANSCTTVIASYVSIDHVAIEQRQARWRHAHTTADVIGLFEHAGFRLVEVLDLETQSIIVLRRRASPPQS